MSETAGGADLTSEVAFLKRVAAAHRGSPIVRTVVAELERAGVETAGRTAARP